MASKTCTTRKLWLESHGQWAHFVHRDQMVRKHQMAKASLPKAVPPTQLPVDCTGDGSVQAPMLGNDAVGDCGPVMCAHMDQIRTYGQGKPGFTECFVDQTALVSQYEQYSGGDNGTDETMLVGPGGAWIKGLAGDPTAVVVDHLDVDVTDVALTQYCNDQFYGVCVGWSVPDAVLQSFQLGVVYAAPGVPNVNNGHYTPITDVGGPSTVAADGTNVNGFYRLFTWGAWCWISPAFLASVQPQAFITFSPLQFGKDGYDSHGRHVSDQAAAWIALGGNASLVNSVVTQFPPKTAPTPVPTPSPTATATFDQAVAWATNGIKAGSPLMDQTQAIAAATSGLAKGYAGTP